MKHILFKKGYKYQLTNDYIICLDISPPDIIATKFLTLSSTGKLIIHEGYAWDGPSGPTIDTPNFMRGSLVHDVLYQLMRLGLLPPIIREYADDLLRDICLEDGMSKFRAWYVHRAVRNFSKASSKPKNAKEEIKAP